jgi:hypothetical protein
METNRSNPYLTALVVVGVLSAVLGLILAGVSNNEASRYSADPGVVQAASFWAATFGQVAVLTLVAALVVAAITWRPTPTPSGDQPASV